MRHSRLLYFSLGSAAFVTTLLAIVVALYWAYGQDYDPHRSVMNEPVQVDIQKYHIAPYLLDDRLEHLTDELTFTKAEINKAMQQWIAENKKAGAK